MYSPRLPQENLDRLRRIGYRIFRVHATIHICIANKCMQLVSLGALRYRVLLGSDKSSHLVGLAFAALELVVELLLQARAGTDDEGNFTSVWYVYDISNP